MLSQEISYSQVQENLGYVLDNVYDLREIIVIKRQNGKNIALIAEEELSSLLESVYLLRSPENAKRLFRSLEWAASGEGISQSLEDLKQEINLESAKKEKS
jgi:antitoxin YefM